MCSQSREYIEESSARRIQQQVLDHQVGLGKDRRRTEEERRGRNVARNNSLNRLKLLAAANCNSTAAAREFRPKGPQRLLAVIACAKWLFHAGLAFRHEPGKQYSGLHLRALNRRLVLNRMKPSATDAQRRALTLRAADLCAPLPKRRHDPRHRPAGE